MTQIFVDADACPVVHIIEKLAKKYDLSCTLLCDTNHVLQSDYAEVKVIGAGADAVDFALVNMARKGDIVCTQDYGVAAMVLGKGCYAIHQSGLRFTNDNIDELLMRRHITKKVRRSSKKSHLKGPGKRTIEDDIKFEESLEKLINRIVSDTEKDVE